MNFRNVDIYLSSSTLAMESECNIALLGHTTHRFKMKVIEILTYILIVIGS